MRSELWPPSPYGSTPLSPYGSIPSSPLGDIPTSPYQVDPATTSEFLDGDEFEQRLKFNALRNGSSESGAGAFTPKQPTSQVAIASATAPTANALGHAAAAAAATPAYSSPITTPVTDGAQIISPGSSESKFRKSKYRTPPLLPYVRVAIDQVRKGHQSVSKVATTCMYNGKPLISARTLRRCVEQSQSDPTSVFYYPLLENETPLKTGRKNKKHQRADGPVDRYSSMTVAELKVEMKSRGLKQKGNKAALLQRLREADRMGGL